MAKKKNVPPRKWYYDACTLEKEMILKEIVNMSKKYPRIHIISHLSLGEAYGNCYGKGEEAAEFFLELMKELKRYLRNIEIVGNDCSSGITDYVRESFPDLATTDALHLATAVKEKCCVLKTIDPYLYNQPKQKIQNLKEKFNLRQFTITRM